MATSSDLGAAGVAPAAASAPHIGSHASVSSLIATIVRSARDVVVHALEVAALESRLAGLALASIVGTVFGILVLALSAWGLLLAAGVSWLTTTGISVPASLLIAAGANVLVAALLALLVPRLARRLMFSATRRVIGRMGSKP